MLKNTLFLHIEATLKIKDLEELKDCLNSFGSLNFQLWNSAWCPTPTDL
jgi:hypothetical protein